MGMNRQNSSDPQSQKNKHSLKEKEEVQHEYVQKTRQRGREGGWIQWEEHFRQTGVCSALITLTYKLGFLLFLHCSPLRLSA